MPEQAPEAQPEQAAPEPQAREHAPIVSAAMKTRDIATDLHNKALDTATQVNDTMKSVLRMDDPGDATQEPLKGILKVPFQAAGDMIDGSAGNVARRAWEVTESAAPAVRGAYRTLKNPIFHPIETLKHPIQYLANPTRIVTSAVKTAKNAIGTIPNFLDDFSNRFIKRPLQRIPLVGGLLGKIGSLTSWITGGIKSGYKYCTDWIDNVDDAVASHQ